MFTLSESSKKHREGVDPRLIEICDLAITLTKIDFGIPKTGGVRNEDTQYGLYLEKKSKADGKIKKSYHQTGKALDFYAFVNGKASWDEEHLTMVACAFLQAACILGYKLEWGGLWTTFKDYPHVQIT